jgi:hypothetical protein
MTKPKYGPYEFIIRYDSTERKLIFVVNGEKHVWDIAEMDAEESQRIANSAKKAKVAERTLAERKFCEIDQFYYSEMFTCPICYGADRERIRIIELLEGALNYSEIDLVLFWADKLGGTQVTKEELIELIKGEQK